MSSYASGVCYPVDITAGPDGALWFTEYGIQPPDPPPCGGATDAIGQITTAGVVTIYSVSGALDSPNGITADDGDLWFTQGRSIGEISTAGAVTVYPDEVPFIGDGASAPFPAEAVTAGPDAALWMTGVNQIVQVVPAT